MRIAFCGVGAVGSTTAVLCRQVGATLRFIDFDRVESKNLLSQAFVKQSNGKNKATALKLQFGNFWGLKTEAYGVRLTEQNCAELLGECELLVDCFDNYDSRMLLSSYARSNGKALVHAALSGDGTYGIVRWDAQFAPDREDVEGQATCEGGEHLPMIGQLAAALARVIQDYVVNGDQHDAMVSLSGITRP